MGILHPARAQPLRNAQIRLFKGRNEYVRKGGEPIGSLEEAKTLAEERYRLALSVFYAKY